MQVSVLQTTTYEQWKARTRLTVDRDFRRFVDFELLPAIGMDAGEFWSGLESIVDELGPQNRRLLKTRDELQQKIDAWHRDRQLHAGGSDDYIAFLREIGYLVPTGKPFDITTANVDAEIASIAGPQLVVPVSNARFAINAANARWGSLYDALYGTDVIPREGKLAPADAYNAQRGQAVIDYAARFLDSVLPLRGARHADVVDYRVETVWRKAECVAYLKDGTTARLQDRWQFVAYTGREPLRSLLFCNNGLHIELCIDAEHPVGRSARAHICDVLLESAITTIHDCEDSVAAVDAEDKVDVYRNWLGLMQGTLEASFEKNGKNMTRKLEEDRRYTAVDGRMLTLPGRSLMLVRNVGHLMTTDAVIDGDGNEVFEGILDAIITVACALADLHKRSTRRNSRAGSVYIVKPKMHGPDEVRFADTLFSRVEAMFGLLPNTIKIGVMDEERRTSANLVECIRAVKSRIVFINTGFLDRTGDEIHTSMRAGPVLPKDDIKNAGWISAYEDQNVDAGLACGFPGKAQIGKGMWPKPDEMAQMMDAKSSHPAAGASCAWVPSPTAATLHAMHYHAIDVFDVQKQIAARPAPEPKKLLTPPLGDPAALTPERIQAELDNNAQGILGYVVRWIDQGVGCSKVPDIGNVGLMEDRATLRISSQHIANWLLHGICDERQVRATFERMAEVVDRQNAGDPAYRNMAPDFDESAAFQAALELVLSGRHQPNGYTEPLLHYWRRIAKAAPAPPEPTGTPTRN